MRWPGEELFSRFCPHLEETGATEGHQRQIGLPGEEFFSHLCPYLDEAGPSAAHPRFRSLSQSANISYICLCEHALALSTENSLINGIGQDKKAIEGKTSRSGGNDKGQW